MVVLVPYNKQAQNWGLRISESVLCLVLIQKTHKILNNAAGFYFS